MKLKINEDTISNLVRDYLLEDYLILQDEVVRLKGIRRLGVLESFHQEDLKANKKYIRAIKAVLEYYTTPDELAQLVESGRCG